MDQDLLKTSTKQRIIIGAIAILMLGSMIASYAAIVLSRGDSSTSDLDAETQALVAKYEDEYRAVSNAVAEASSDYYNEFVGYRSEITAFNETAANSGSIVSRDLKEGWGRELVDGDTDYLAFYVGWCPDESVFDSSFDNDNRPTKFSQVLDPAVGLIEGWNSGIAGMKMYGIREITIPSEWAYGESQQICGGYNKPLKFIIMAVEKSGALKEAADKLSLIQTKIQYAYYGLDYDEMMGTGDYAEGGETE